MLKKESKMSKALLINREDLVRFTPLSGNIDFDKVIQYVEIAQDIHVHESIVQGSMPSHFGEKNSSWRGWGPFAGSPRRGKTAARAG